MLARTLQVTVIAVKNLYARAYSNRATEQNFLETSGSGTNLSEQVIQELIRTIKR